MTTFIENTNVKLIQAAHAFMNDYENNPCDSDKERYDVWMTWQWALSTYKTSDV